MDSYSTVVELLLYRASYQSQTLAFTFLEDGETETETLTYQELDRRSQQIAFRLQTLNLTGERALLLYPSGLDYLVAFCGCLYAGVIAVPAYPPRNQRNTPRIEAIVTDAQPAVALTTKTLLPRMESLLGKIENLQWLATDNLEAGIEASWQQPNFDKDTIAFLQYTSGSTGTPKGVMVSHGNLLHNAATTYQMMGHSPKSRFVSWLPMYHDMGLIGGILQPLYGGFPCVLMPPSAFLQRPYRWLQAISRYQGTTSGAPNFAYELCIQKITTEQLETLDLSSWNVAFNGAEPIQDDTLNRFWTKFALCGFSPQAFYPCYGMAEATLMISGGRRISGKIRGHGDTGTRRKEYLREQRNLISNDEFSYTSKTVDKLALSQDRIVEVLGEEKESKTIVGCGRSIPGQEVVIVNPETLVICPSGKVGEIWVRGDSVAKGYWNRLEETKQTFQACLTDSRESSFLHTGDLGFLDDTGELFITGRVKDLIVIRGRNLYPQDIELTAERSHAALRLSSNAAFTVEVENEERLVVVQELEFRAKPNLESVITAIRQRVTEAHEVQVYGVILIKPGSIPKTSSGKIQRRATRNQFLESRLNTVASSILENKEFVDAETKLTREELLQKSSQEAQLLLEAYLQTRIARVLKRLPQEVEIDRPLTGLGLDSLKVFELKNRIEADLEVSIAIADFFAELTARSLATKILAQLETANANESVSLKKITTNNNIHPVSFAQARLSDLPLLSDREKQQLLVDWNPTPSDISQNLLIHQLFEQQAAKTPKAVAVISEREQLTYQELNKRAEQLAIYLQSIGVKPEVIVGICIERSLEVIIAILGILKAGGAYLPLDLAYPQERIDLIIKDAQISLLLTQHHLIGQLSTQSVRAIAIDTEWQTINQQHNQNLIRYINLDNLAYVIYTSGSTGKPKGVAISHRSLVNFAQAAVREYQVTPSERILQFANISFDASVEEIYSCLISGSTLVLRTEEMGYSPSLLLLKCRDYGITVLDLPTAFWHLLITELESNSTLELPSSIRLVIIGGETVNPDKVTSWNRLVGESCQLINTYGPTEATVVATSYKMPHRIDGLSSIPIGKPLPNTQAYILDKNLAPVAIGVPGELYLGGVSLAREYLNNPQLTQERFISIPPQSPLIKGGARQHGVICDRLYKTGDIARYLSDSNIAFLGRIDNQVKIRGFRVELTEIEAVINGYQNIKQAVVLSKEDTTGKKNLVAYVVLKEPEKNKDTEQLIQQLKIYSKQYLPDYMIPIDWQVLKELPLTPNGKLDRQTLKTIKGKDFSRKVSTNNKQEQIIAEIWQEILQRENIDVNDNFFDVGGHSLLLAQLQEKVEQSLQVNLTITDLFKYSSISSLADYLSQKEDNLLISSDRTEQFLSRIDRQKAALARKKQLRRARK